MVQERPYEAASMSFADLQTLILAASLLAFSVSWLIRTAFN